MQAAGSGDLADKRVLVVHSYDRGFAWTADIDEAVKRTLLPAKARIRTFFMDTNLRPDAPHLAEAGRQAEKIMLEYRPHVVIVSDDNAQKHFAARYAGNATAPAFVFCGVNRDPSDYGYPADNVTGVTEELAWDSGLKLLRRLKPSIRAVRVLMDARPSSRAGAELMRASTPPDIEAEWVVVQSFAHWRESVLDASETCDALAIMTYHNLTDEHDRIVPSRDVIFWTRDNADLPTLGFFDYTVADGALCGVIQTGFEHGALAAKLALRILGGERAGDIPIITSTRGLTMLNAATAEKLGIEIPFLLSQEAAAIVE
jgi:hypothetical protein